MVKHQTHYFNRDAIFENLKTIANSRSFMKTQHLTKWISMAGLALTSLFTLPVAQAANIIWGATGTFSDNTVLALAGPAAREFYGVDAGGSGAQTTANGYTFADYVTSGNASITGGPSSYNNFLGTAGSTGDAAMDNILNYGLYGGNMPGTLNNLTVGASYTAIALLIDTRGVHQPTDTFNVSDGVTTSPNQVYSFSGGSPAVGGYIIGIFTASATTQTFTVHATGGGQYNAILVISNPPPLAPLPVLISNTQPASATAGVGGQAAFTAAFSNSPPVSLQWQFVSGGSTNPVTAANAAVVTVTNSGVVVSTLTFNNLQVTNAGSYRLKAVNATNSLGVVYSSAATLTVAPLIQWLQTGAFTDDTFLALAGTPANEVYGVDFGGTAFQTTVNGYTFDDYAATGNMSVAGNVSSYGGYLPNGDTGDAGLNIVLQGGIYGGGDMTGTLNNLTVGQTYNVLVILDDTRTGPISAPTQVPQTVFYGTDGVSVSPYQPFVFPGATNASGGNAVGAYALGTFTARSTSQPLSVLTASLAGQFGLTAQYNAILVETSTVAPPVPPIYLNANTFPIPASSVLPLYFPAQSNFPIPTSTAPLAGEPAVMPEGGNIGFSAAFVNYFAPNNLQWQVITNGVTNNINAGVNIGVVTVTNNLGIVTSTLTFSNLQLSAAGSYQLKAVNATNSSDVAYSTPYPLIVVPTISWGATGTFTDNTVLALAGSVANEVYGVDFGGSGAQTTANGYSFADNVISGNMSLAGGTAAFGGYMTGGATTGDAGLDTMLTDGLYNSAAANPGTLNNLTIGQKYTVLALLDDTRGGSAGPSPTFTVTDGVTTSPSQQFQFANGSPSVGGYIMGTFTAHATTQALTVRDGGNTQYNVILLEKFTATPPTPPTLGAPKVSGGNLILTGTGGTPNSGYTWLSTTNLLAQNWITNTTGTLDGAGAFSNAIPVSTTTPASFFRLRLP